MQITFDSNVVVDFELNFKSHSKFISFEINTRADAKDFILRCIDEATCMGTNAFESSVYSEDLDNIKYVTYEGDYDEDVEEEEALAMAIDNVLMYYNVDLGTSDFIEDAIVQKCMKIDLTFGRKELHFASANDLYESLDRYLKEIFDR